MADTSTRSLVIGGEGKSRACRDCKRRKVKCDNRRPTCLRCEKAHIACQGYQRDTVFVNRTLGNNSTITLPVERKASPAQKVSRKDFDEDLRVLTWQVQTQTAPRPHFRLHALELIKQLYLPQLSQAELMKTSLFSWILIICEMSGESDALDYSLLTFCVVQVALTKTGSGCVGDALRFYNDAIQKVVVELENDDAGKSDELLAAISVLSTYEIFVFSGDHTWVAHAQGLSEILRIRSGMDSPSPFMVSFCSRVRIVLIIEALVKRDDSSMASTQLRQLLTLDHVHDQFHQMVDVVSEVPRLLEQTDLLIASRDRIPVNMWENIFDSHLLALERLYSFCENLRAEKRRLLYWAVPASAHNPADVVYGSNLFPFALEYESLTTASSVVFVWATAVQVLWGIIDLHEHFFAKRSSGREPLFNSRFPTISSVKDEANRLARKLCQSVEYCYKTENGIIGPQMTCYAQWVVRSYFRRFGFEREVAWCANIKNMKGPRFRHGIELMAFHGSK